MAAKTFSQFFENLSSVRNPDKLIQWDTTILAFSWSEVVF